MLRHLTILTLITLLTAACAGTPTPAPSPTPSSTPASPSPAPPPSPTPDTATLAGQILDRATGAPVAGAAVRAGALVTTTDEQGRYTLSGLPPGQVVLSVTGAGYDPALSAIIPLDAGQQRSQDLTLYAEEETPYPQDPMLTNPFDPAGASTAEEAERLARAQGFTGEMVSIEETHLSGPYLVNYKDGEELRAAVATLDHGAWALTDAAGRTWWVLKVCGNLVRPLPAGTTVATPAPKELPLQVIAAVGALAVRRCPQTDCGTIATVERGTRLEVAGCLEEGGWCRVVLEDGREGWCRRAELRFVAALAAVPAVAAGEPRIAFISDRASPNQGTAESPSFGDIYIMNRDGSNQRQLSAGLEIVGATPDSIYARDFEWLPVHKRFYYSTAGGRLYAWSVETDKSLVVDPEEMYVHNFDVSSTDQIVVWDSKYRHGRYGEIRIMDFDGTNLTTITGDETRQTLGLRIDSDFSHPTWSPDQTQVAFVSNDRDGVIIMNVDGTDARFFSMMYVYEPKWSPDGRYIAGADLWDLYLFDIQDGSVSKLVENGVDPAWSPDGRQIAFARDGQIWIINRDGSGLRQLTFEGQNCCATWVPAADAAALPQQVVTLPSPTPAPTATPRPLNPLPACPDPHSRITFPRMGDRITDIVSFQGSADVDNFQYYKFEYRPAGEKMWRFLVRFDEPVTKGELMEWHTYTVPPGDYELQLTVVDRTGNYPPRCVVRVTVY